MIEWLKASGVRLLLFAANPTCHSCIATHTQQARNTNEQTARRNMSYAAKTIDVQPHHAAPAAANPAHAGHAQAAPASYASPALYGSGGGPYAPAYAASAVVVPASVGGGVSGAPLLPVSVAPLSPPPPPPRRSYTWGKIALFLVAATVLGIGLGLLLTGLRKRARCSKDSDDPWDYGFDYSHCIFTSTAMIIPGALLTAIGGGLFCLSVCVCVCSRSRERSIQRAAALTHEQAQAEVAARYGLAPVAAAGAQPGAAQPGAAAVAPQQMRSAPVAPAMGGVAPAFPAYAPQPFPAQAYPMPQPAMPPAYAPQYYGAPQQPQPQQSQQAYMYGQPAFYGTPAQQLGEQPGAMPPGGMPAVQ